MAEMQIQWLGLSCFRLEMGGAEFDGTVQARLDALRRSLAATV